MMPRTIHLFQRRALTRMSAGFGALVMIGCASPMKVDAPDTRQPGDFANASGASSLAVGAITSFARPFGGTYSYVVWSGLLADEVSMATSSAFETGADWDRRDLVEPTLSNYGPYVYLQPARIQLLNAISAMERNARDSTARIGQLFSLLGYAETFLSETYCSGVPLGALDANYNPVFGKPLTTDELLARALADYDSALAYGKDSTRILNLARVGKARALVNVGRFNDAATLVASVPTSYVYAVTFVANTNTGFNGFADVNWGSTWTIPDREGTNGMNWRTANDPRAQVVRRTDVNGGDGATEIWSFAPYRTSTAPITMASGIEARLIEAEAALQAGNAGQWLGILNTLRASAITPPMAALTDPGSANARVDLLFRERAFWLFLTGHRQADLRRLVRQYGRGAETVYPTGGWRDGANYGTATNMSLPASETSNPNFTGCLSRKA